MKKLLLAACISVAALALNATPYLDLSLKLDNLDALLEIEETVYFDENNHWHHEQSRISIDLTLQEETETGILIQASVFNKYKEVLAEPNLEVLWEEPASLGLSDTAGRTFTMAITAHKK